MIPTKRCALSLPFQQKQPLHCKGIKNLACIVRSKANQNKFAIDFKRGVIEYSNTLNEIKLFLKSQRNFKELQNITCSKVKANGTFIRNKSNEIKQLVDVIEEHLETNFITVRNVTFYFVDSDSDERAKKLATLLKKRKDQRVEVLITRLESIFKDVKDETDEGFQYLREKECMEKLKISKVKLQELVDFGEKKDMLKYGNVQGEKVVCYIFIRRLNPNLLF